MSKELWQITGKWQGRTFTVKVRAANHRDAVRIGSTTHMLVVHDCVLLESTAASEVHRRRNTPTGDHP